MPHKMRIELKIDPECQALQIIVPNDRVTEEISALVKKLSGDSPQFISGFRVEILHLLEPNEIHRFYTADGKVFVETEKGELVLRLLLYELEDRLNASQFVRISHSEIINIRKALNFDLNLSVSSALHCKMARLASYRGAM